MSAACGLEFDGVHDTSDAEHLLLGSLMADKRLIDKVADLLNADDFYKPIYGRIYSAIIHEHSIGKGANAYSLRSYFADDPAIDELGGVGILVDMVGRAEPIGVTDLARQIADYAVRRRMLVGFAGTMDLANDPTTSNEQIIEAADAALGNLTGNQAGAHQLSGAQCLEEVLVSFNEPKLGVLCGVIGSVDRLVGPMRPKELVIGAARPGMGKTAFALSYGIGAAMNGHGVLFVSLEMSSKELGARIAADMCFDQGKGVAFDLIRNATARGEDFRRIVAAQKEMALLPFQVIDVGHLTVGRLSMFVRRNARRMAAKGAKLELVIVDYLQLVSPDVARKSYYEAISEVSRGLKAIAKDHGVAVLALAQLSREVEKRPDHRPQLSDLRDSGHIEQDADVVIFLTRDEYYHRLEEPDPGTAEHAKWLNLLQRMQGKIDFICAKQRNGQIGTEQGEFHGAYQAVRG